MFSRSLCGFIPLCLGCLSGAGFAGTAYPAAAFCWAVCGFLPRTLPGCELWVKCMHRNKIDMPRTKRLTRRAFALYAALVLVCCAATPVLAEGDPLTVVNNLSTFIFSIIRAIGLILLGWGIVQVGLSLQSHDPSQRSQGFLTLAGGIIITFAKEILDLIVGTGV